MTHPPRSYSVGDGSYMEWGVDREDMALCGGE